MIDQSRRGIPLVASSKLPRRPWWAVFAVSPEGDRVEEEGIRTEAAARAVLAAHRTGGWLGQLAQLDDAGRWVLLAS